MLDLRFKAVKEQKKLGVSNEGKGNDHSKTQTVKDKVSVLVIELVVVDWVKRVKHTFHVPPKQAQLKSLIKLAQASLKFKTLLALYFDIYSYCLMLIAKQMKNLAKKKFNSMVNDFFDVHIKTL